MRTLFLLITMTLLAACSAAPARVRCARHLVPINPPQRAAAPPVSP